MGKIYQVQVYGIEGEMRTIDLCNTEVEMQKFTVLQLRKNITQKILQGRQILQIKRKTSARS
uniref:Ubiquitin-like domain-containing protein n=1 Tax=Monopterus albus TaxID=43700 RepID=A0A3Q3Q166_MONAL